MNDLNRQYFDAESHWADGMLTDEFNSERINVTKSIIPADVSNLLDAGCGNGVFLESLMQDRPEMELVGLDRSVTALKYVQAKKVEGNIASLPFDDNSFDCVTSLEVIEHLPENVFHKALSEVTRVSRKYVVISVPFNEKLENNFTKCPSCKSVFNRDLHVRNFTEKRFTDLLLDFGYHARETKKVGSITRYVAHSDYLKIFRSHQFYRWDVPVCPICGFRDNHNNTIARHLLVRNGGLNTNHSLTKALLKFPKMLWPKTTSYYWIVGLFVKNS